MKKAFTLIELIFVIVIIGLLAAVAVPKFVNLKQSAEASNVVKTTIDIASAAVNVAINLRDLEGDNNFTLKNLVKLDGKGWKYKNDNDGKYQYYDSINEQVIAEITLYKNKNIIKYKIDCEKFNDEKTKTKCKKLLGNVQNSIEVNLTY